MIDVLTGFLFVLQTTRIKDSEYTVDPARVPTKSNEITFLVRLLYQVSNKLNLMVSIFYFLSVST